MNVYRPGGTFPLAPNHLAIWANKVAVECGGARKGPFTTFDFLPGGKDYRLNGNHCRCGSVDGTPNTPSLGEFELLPIEDEAVQQGMKAYMRCRKCGDISHL